MNRLSEDVDQGDDEDLREKAANFIGDTVMPEFVEDCELLYRCKTPVQEEVGEFKEVG